MSSLLYSATMSLDGFIAGPGGDMSWLTPHLGHDPAVDDLIPRIGTLLVASRTFRPRDTPVPGVTFVGDLCQAIDAAKQCLQEGLLDEVLAFVAPRPRVTQSGQVPGLWFGVTRPRVP